MEVGRVKKRKNKKKKFHAETDKDIDGNRSKLATSGNRQDSEKVPLVEDHVDELPTQGGRTFPKGLIVEETCRGKPDGKCEWRLVVINSENLNSCLACPFPRILFDLCKLF